MTATTLSPVQLDAVTGGSNRLRVEFPLSENHQVIASPWSTLNYTVNNIVQQTKTVGNSMVEWSKTPEARRQMMRLMRPRRF